MNATDDEFEPDLIYIYCHVCDDDYEVPEDISGQYYCLICGCKIYAED